MAKPKVAIVCDWLTGIGGAERVVLEMHKLYPDAPIFTSQYNPDALALFKYKGIDELDIRTGWLQKLPSGLKKFLPLLRAWYFSRLDLSEYDLILSSSGAEAKGVKRRNGATHISYVHSPTQYYWTRYDEYLERPGFPRGFNWLARLGLKLFIGPLKRWDYRAAQRPDYIITNSTHTRGAIQRCYKRESVVVHPPVETDRFKMTGKAPLRHGFVIAGRQSPYKRFDLAVEACHELKVPLVVIGDGPDHRRLEKLAGRGATFLTDLNDHEIVDHFQSAIGFIMPNMDDFGIVAVEAMAAGTPVIAYKKGGSLDYVVPGKTGVFFENQTVEELAAALESAAKKSFDPATIAEHAQRFSVANFRTNLQNVITKDMSDAGSKH